MISTDTPIGFVGLGTMGVPMVRRLLAAGFTVHGASRSPGPVALLAAEGMVPAGDVGEVAARAEVVLTALPTEEDVDEVAARLLDAGHPGQLLIEHSTISPGLARDVAARAGDVGVAYLDAPVSGGPAGAAAGTLTVMVGGAAEDFERVQQLLGAFGGTLRRCGDVGSGQVIKLINQLLVGVHTAAAAEAAVLGVALGADLETIEEVVGQSFGGSAMLSRTLPRVAQQDFSPATPVRLLLKDLGLIHDEAGRAEVPLRLGATAEQLFLESAARGHGAEDMAALVKLWPLATGPDDGPDTR